MSNSAITSFSSNVTLKAFTPSGGSLTTPTLTLKTTETNQGTTTEVDGATLQSTTTDRLDIGADVVKIVKHTSSPSSTTLSLNAINITDSGVDNNGTWVHTLNISETTCLANGKKLSFITDGSTQTLSGTLTLKDGETALTVPAGIQFNHDAGFMIPNPNYQQSGDPETINVRISDLYSGGGGGGGDLTQLENVVAALCRANYRQVSDQSLNSNPTAGGDTDLSWIQAYATGHKPYTTS